MTKTEEYKARAAEALVDLDNATNERDRDRFRRSHGVWLRLIANVDEAAARIAAPQIRQPFTSQTSVLYPVTSIKLSM